MGSKIYTKAERERMEHAEKASHAKQKHAVPAEEQTALAKLDGATRALAEIRDAPSAKYVMDIAAAAEHFAKKARLGDEAIKHAQGIKYAAEIKLGEYLKQLPEAKRGPRDEEELISHEENKSKLDIYEEIGISPKKAAEAQRLADLPEEAKEQLGAGEIKPSMALRDQKRSTLSTRIAALPPGKFRLIYADPPWKYGDERAGLEKADTAAEGQYPTMPTSQICELAPNGRHISDLADRDAVLFMWATFPLLEDGLQVIKAWGFKYKTAIVWDKQRSNIGNYHDARAELLMIATRGSCPIEIDTRPKQVQSIARSKHSAKPEEFRELIESLYPTAIKAERAIELFRRGTPPKGWTIWGNESEVAT